MLRSCRILKLARCQFIKNIDFLLMLSAICLGGEPSLLMGCDEVKVISITQIVEHDSLNRARQGIIDELKSIRGNCIQFKYESAQGSIPTAVQIAQRFLSDKPDVIVALSTPSAQTFLKGADANIPVVFASVSDPQSAGFTRENARLYMTGTVDTPLVKDQIEFVKEFFPDLKKIGVIYNPGEANSSNFVKNLKSLSQGMGFDVIEGVVSKSSDVAAAVSKVIEDRVHIVLLPQDNTVVSALGVLVKITHEKQIPVFASDIDLLPMGIFAALGYSRYEAGRATGKIVNRILEGTPPSQIQIESGAPLKKCVNASLQKSWGIAVPEKLSQHLIFSNQ